MRAFWSGLAYPVRSAAFVFRTPGLRRYLVLPIILNFLIGAVVFVVLLTIGWRGLESVVAAWPAWTAPLTGLVRVLLIVGLLLLNGFVVVRFGVVLGAPWYGRLADRVEALRLGRPLPAPPGGPLTDIGRALRFEVQKLALVSVVGLGLLLVDLVPVAGPPLGTAGGIALGVLIACLDVLDPSLDRRRLGFWAKLGIVRRSLPASAGLGLVGFALAGLSLLNLITLPILVAAGALFFADRIAPQLARPT